MPPPYEVLESEDDVDLLGDDGPIPADFVAHDDEPERTATSMPDPICALDAPPPVPVRWIVRDLFTSGDVGLIVGDGGSFKSSASIHIAAAVAGGYKAFDRFETVGPAPVLLCSAEDPGSVIQMRLEAFVRGHDWSRVNVLSNFHYFAMAGVRLKDQRWRRHLREVVERLTPALIVLDPFVDLSGLEEENSNSEASDVMGFARSLARQSMANVCFVHHGNKSSEGRSQSRIRGATTIANASRGTLFFEFTDAGVMVEQLKMTYAERVPAFMLQRDIKSEPSNRGQWITAKLATVKPADARLDRAEIFILNQVILSPRELNTNGLKRAAKGSGIWGEDVHKAAKSLFARALIDFEKGPNKSQFWYATDAGLKAQIASGSLDSRNVIEVSRTHSTHRENGRAEWVGGASGSPEATTGQVGRVPTVHGPTSHTAPGPAHPPEQLEEFDETQASAFDDEVES